LTAGTSDQVAAIAAVGATMNAINNQITIQSTLVSTPSPSRTSPSICSQTLLSMVVSAGSLAACVNGGFYISRIGTNLNGTGK
jgi:hypothetical protein